MVVGHHPVFGATSANGYNASAYAPEDKDAFDLGRPDAAGSPSWASLLSLLRKHQPVAYMNGHDHTHALAVDVEKGYKTAYLTEGAGKECHILMSSRWPENL